MKKLLLFILLLTGGISLQAQNFHYGLKAGLNFNKWKISGVDDTNNDGKLDFEIGGIGEYAFSDNFSFKPEMLLVFKGDKTSGDGLTETFSSSYLTFPLMLSYSFNETISINAGPQIGFLLSAEYTEEFDGEEYTEDVSDELNSTELGLNIGTTYKFNDKIFLNLRYTIGLSAINKDTDFIEIKNNTIRFGIGYYFK